MPAIDRILPDGTRILAEAVAPGVFRLRLGTAAGHASTMERYRVVELPAGPPPATLSCASGWEVLATPLGAIAIDPVHGAIELRGADGATRLSTAGAPCAGRGFSATFALSDDERIQGLGDVTRKRVGKRGFKREMWVRNVAAYVPIPWLCSSRGWGMHLNTTWRHYVDVGATRPDRLVVGARQGEADIFLFLGEDYPQLIDRFTALTGRPALLPLWGYGLTFVCNQQADAREMIDDCLNLRRADIPCDLVGLEPGWMSKHYDGSVDKTWHKERFYIPEWFKFGGGSSQNPNDVSHGINPATFMGAASRLGFKLSLWLCCDYDLTWEAERRAGSPPPAAPTAGTDRHPDDFEQDQHFGHGALLQDKETKRDQPWFQHLQQFVDQGACAFKMDGAFQVNDHPDRLWGNGMRDEEAHNLYPTLLNQQMAEGFAAHSGRRPMIYSSGGYTGIQRFSATWAGDTGGGPKPLVSMLNHAFAGHSNVSCDMDVFTPEGIHFGFLMTWAQVNSWAYWRHPWLLGDRLLPMFRAYAKLRYRLLPYIYSAAHTAHDSGLTVMRPLALAFPEDRACDEVLTQYMLGDALHVSVFADRLYLPPGLWYDFWSGERIEGGRHIPATWPAGRGGALHVRAGSVIPLWPEMDYVGQKPVDHLELLVYPGADGAASLHEDDGVRLPAADQRACTRFTLRSDASGADLRIPPRHGCYDGMPAQRSYTVRVFGPRPVSVQIDGQPGTWSHDGGSTVITALDATSAAREIRLRW